MSRHMAECLKQKVSKWSPELSTILVKSHLGLIQGGGLPVVCTNTKTLL